MTSEQQRKLKIIRLDEKQQQQQNLDSDKTLDTIHDELEHALNNSESAEKTAFVLTIETAKAEEERLRKEGKDSDKHISKICSIICKRHRIHERQIQRYFNYVDETGNKPYRKYSRQYSRDQLKNPTHDGNIYETNLKADDTIAYLRNLLAEGIDEYGRDEYHQITDLLWKNIKHSENEFNRNDLKYINPYDTRRGDRMDAERRKITLQPADIPKDELIRLFQKYEGKQMYDFGKMFTKFGDKLIKMNYISDNPELNASLLTMHIEQMTEIAASNCLIINEFLTKYWDKHIKGKEKLDEEDKEQLRRLWRSLANISIAIKFGDFKT